MGRHKRHGSLHDDLAHMIEEAIKNSGVSCIITALTGHSYIAYRLWARHCATRIIRSFCGEELYG